MKAVRGVATIIVLILVVKGGLSFNTLFTTHSNQKLSVDCEAAVVAFKNHLKGEDCHKFSIDALNIQKELESDQFAQKFAYDYDSDFGELEEKSKHFDIKKDSKTSLGHVIMMLHLLNELANKIKMSKKAPFNVFNVSELAKHCTDEKHNDFDQFSELYKFHIRQHLIQSEAEERHSEHTGENKVKKASRRREGSILSRVFKSNKKMY